MQNDYWYNEEHHATYYDTTNGWSDRGSLRLDKVIRDGEVKWRISTTCSGRVMEHMPTDGVGIAELTTYLARDLAKSILIETDKLERSDSKDNAKQRENAVGRDKAQTKHRWRCWEVELHIKKALEADDPELTRMYLFLGGKKLASKIGCNVKTLRKTEFWKHRAEWRRLAAME